MSEGNIISNESELHAQGLTNSPAITSIDTAGRCLFATCAQVCALTKIVTPKLAGHISIGDLKVKEEGEFWGKGDTSTTKKVMFGLTPSVLLSRTFLVTPHLPGSWSAKGLWSEAEKAFHGGICKAKYGKGRRNLPHLPFGPGAGLVTPLLGGNRQEGWLDHTANTTYPCPNGSGFCPTNAQIVVNLAAKGSEVMPKMQLETHEVQTVTKARKGGNGYAGLL